MGVFGLVVLLDLEVDRDVAALPQRHEVLALRRNFGFINPDFDTFASTTIENEQRKLDELTCSLIAY